MEKKARARCVAKASEDILLVMLERDVDFQVLEERAKGCGHQDSKGQESGGQDQKSRNSAPLYYSHL